MNKVLVGGVICLVNSVNERDLFLLNSYMDLLNLTLLRGTLVSVRVCFAWYRDVFMINFLEGLFVSSEWKREAITGSF